MATNLGALVGTPLAAFPPQQVDKAFSNTTDTVLIRDRCVLAAAAIGDTVTLATLGWDTIIDPITSDLYFDALGAASTLSVGDVTYPAALAAATDTHTAAGSLKVMKTITIGNWFQPLWKALGYADRPTALAVGPQCVLLATIAGGAATGSVAWQLKGQPRS